MNWAQIICQFEPTYQYLAFRIYSIQLYKLPFIKHTLFQASYFACIITLLSFTNSF